MDIDVSDQSTADTGPATDGSPNASRQYRLGSSPPRRGGGPLLELPLPINTRRSRSEDHQSPAAWTPTAVATPPTLPDFTEPSDVSSAVASILNSPAFLLALSSQLESSPTGDPHPAAAAELLASLLPALAADPDDSFFMEDVPPPRRRLDSLSPNNHSCLSNGVPTFGNQSWSSVPTADSSPTDAWGAEQAATLLPPGLLPPDWASWASRCPATPSTPSATDSARRHHWRNKRDCWTPPHSTTSFKDDDARSPTTPQSHPPLSPGDRSKLLHEFRAGQVSIPTLFVLKNQMIDFALDQSGARFIQQRLASCPPQEAQYARDILLPKTKLLVTDVFGNHIVQRLLETGTSLQKHQIFLQLKGDILRLALQTYGCRVLQKALETLCAEDKLAFAGELQAHVVRCVEDQNGNHVIQKCIERLPAEQIQFIIDAFRGQVARVSAHCYGCRVIQRVLEHCPAERINHLLDEIMDRLVRLAQDQYGNYVVQHVLRYGRLEDRQAIVDRIASDLLLMSSHKYSSNVVEKCLELRATPDARCKIIGAAFGDPTDPRPPIMQMVRDRYANYVVQRMLDVTTQEDSEGLMDEVVGKLERHMPALRKFTYGKHIAAALERLRKQREDMREELAKSPSEKKAG